MGALIFAVLAFGLAGLLDYFLPQRGQTALFWLGVVCLLAAAWGMGGA
jgi:hypothetical protein